MENPARLGISSMFIDLSLFSIKPPVSMADDLAHWPQNLTIIALTC